MTRQITVCADPQEAADSAASYVADCARRAVADHGVFTIAVSGGRSPWLMLSALARYDMPWEHTRFYQVDERICSVRDPLRNLVGLRGSLPPNCPAAVLAMPVQAGDLQAACDSYAAVLPEQFDLIHLGLGADGHTASLLPGDAALQVTAADVALTGVYQERNRMTLTYPRIARAAAILWLVTGADKATALRQLLGGDPGIPATGVQNAEQVMFCDKAAAGDPRA